jgi:hypothetical protein
VGGGNLSVSVSPALKPDQGRHQWIKNPEFCNEKFLLSSDRQEDGKPTAYVLP